MRFNYSENDGMQLWEIAEALGVSSQQVHRIEQAALAKLRTAMEQKGYSASDFYDTEAKCESGHTS